MSLAMRFLLFLFTIIASLSYVSAASTNEVFTIRVTWKCLSPSVIGNYPCRNSSETLTSFPGGIVYVYAGGVHCDNASAQAPNAYKLAIGKRSSGTLLCKTQAYDGVIKYSGTVKATKDGYAVDLSGKFTAKWGAGLKQNKQSLSFSYAATFKADGSRCFGTKNWRFNGQMNSVPGASGRYTYTASQCVIGK
jgi:hypothetical protein